MKIHKLTVLPDTPEELNKLQELAYNLYFSWDDEVIDLYREMDEELWKSCDNSPVYFLSEVSQDTMYAYAKNNAFIEKLNRVHEKFTHYMKEKTWYDETYAPQKTTTMAYFSCEYGLHDSIPIYSGGLGVLSGDHVKTASDLGLPFVGVGLLYKSGYFRQKISQDGMQVEDFKSNSFYDLPVTPVLNDKGKSKVFFIMMGGEKLYYQVWQVAVGRVKILLLDTFVAENTPDFQYITNKLYDGDRETRIRQEYLLGIGGFHLLKHLGYDIKMYHINEGHSAFLLLEHIRHLMKLSNLSFEEASHFVTERSLFTTHTPVPAGNERFSLNLVEKYFLPVAEELGISWDYFLSLGREFPDNPHEEFCLTVLALKFCGTSNGVSQLHGAVSRNMWQNLYPNIPEHEIPIYAITNGVHGQTWMNRNLRELMHTKRVDKNPQTVLYDNNFFDNITLVSDKELWDWKQKCKNALVELARTHLETQYLRSNADTHLVDQAKQILDPNALTIGFARRFATYKRGNLFLRDRARLQKIVKNTKRPVQFIIAGKAHPADQNGKDIIKEIHMVARELGISDRVVFLENYHINLARYIVSGVDIWLNNPVKPQEASGTSGMKAGMNGVLNLSITDGWWAEAYNSKIGWNLSALTDESEGNDDIEADMLYHCLENQIPDLYFDKNAEGIPEKWVAMMKQSVVEVGGYFNFVRTLKEYTNYYVKIVDKSTQLEANEYKLMHEFSEWKKKIYRNWPNVEIVELEKSALEKIKREDSIKVSVKVVLGKLSRDDVTVQCYSGSLATTEHSIIDGIALEMKFVKEEKSVSTYEIELKPIKGGRLGYTVRVLPKHNMLLSPFFLGLVTWYDEE